MRLNCIMIAGMMFASASLAGQSSSLATKATASNASYSPALHNPVMKFLKDERTIDGYRVRITTNPAGSRGYGFDVLTSDRKLMHRFPNPFPFKTAGIQSKQDIYKIATWIISDYKARGRWQNILTPKTASQLNISTK